MDTLIEITVKPLEWEELDGNFEGQKVWRPKNGIWPCWIVKNPDSDYLWCEEIGIEFYPASPIMGTFKDIEDAIAAVDTDYVKRIRERIAYRIPTDG